MRDDYVYQPEEIQQSKPVNVDLVEDSLEIVDGWVQVPDWYLTASNSRDLATLLRAVVRLQYRTFKTHTEYVES